jgi:hypothetical protein
LLLANLLAEAEDVIVCSDNGQVVGLRIPTASTVNSKISMNNMHYTNKNFSGTCMLIGLLQ